MLGHAVVTEHSGHGQDGDDDLVGLVVTAEGVMHSPESESRQWKRSISAAYTLMLATVPVNGGDAVNEEGRTGAHTSG